MSITVSDALKIGRLQEAKVLGGASGLGNIVRTVDIIDVPDAAIWFRRDSLLSTTFYALKGNLEAQLKMLEDITACGGAGLVIFSPERYITEIDERLIQKADELSLPLLQMPDCSYIDVIVPVMSKILDKQIASLEYAQEVHSLMVNFVLKGRSLAEIMFSLSSLINLPVVMADPDLILSDYEVPKSCIKPIPLIECLRQSQGYMEFGDCYPPEILKAAVENKKPRYYCHKESGKLDFLFPITAGNTFYGLIIVPDLDRELAPDKTVALEAASLAIALNILKEREIRDAKQKNELDFFNELLLGNLKSRENIIAHAAQLGMDLDGPYCLILVELSRETPYRLKMQGPKTGLAGDNLEKKLQRQLRSALNREHPQNIMAEALGSNIVLLRLPESWKGNERIHRSKLIMERLKNILQKRMGDIPVYMAMGGIYDNVEQVSSSYIQAWETMEIGKKLLPPGFAVYNSDMEPYHLVKRFLISSSAVSLYERVYESLLKYDREKDGELVLTLETYIKCNYSRNRTARQLHIHRNTLNYRLSKINELLGLDVDQMDSFPFLLASISRKLST